MVQDRRGVFRGPCTVCTECPEYEVPPRGHQCDYCGHKPAQHLSVRSSQHSHTATYTSSNPSAPNSSKNSDTSSPMSVHSAGVFPTLKATSSPRSAKSVPTPHYRPDAAVSAAADRARTMLQKTDKRLLKKRHSAPASETSTSHVPSFFIPKREVVESAVSASGGGGDDFLKSIGIFQCFQSMFVPSPAERHSQTKTSKPQHSLPSPQKTKTAEEIAAIKHVFDSALTLAKAQKYVEAIAKFKEVLAMDPDDRQLSSVYSNCGLMHNALGEYDEAILWHQRRLEHCERIEDKTGQLAAYSHLAQAFRVSHRPDQAIHHAVQCLELAREVGDKDREGRACDVLADLHAELGNVDEAISYLDLRLEHYRAAGDHTGESKLHFDKGALLMRFSRFNDALPCLNRVTELSRLHGDTLLEAQSLENRGVAYVSLGHTAKAVELLKECVRLCSELKDDVMAARCNAVLASLYRQLGITEQAEEHFTLYRQHSKKVIKSKSATTPKPDKSQWT